jgi:hypothetical protein
MLDKIHQMAGKFLPHLTYEVTHLIARGVTSDKYRVILSYHSYIQVASRLGITVVNSEWLDACYDMAKNECSTENAIQVNLKYIYLS